MDKTLDYECVPHAFSHCFNHQCLRSEECMRHFVANNITPKYPSLEIVNPMRIPENTAQCPYFHPIRRVQVAWGIKKLFDQIPYKNAVLMRKQIIHYFGKTKYYRFFRQESGLMPEDQAYISRLFQQNGMKEKPKYEKYTEQYTFD